MESKAFIYTLEPYKGPDSRHTCPACGAAHKFARYIDSATGQYIADEVGRCDREDSCGYHLKPRDYFSQHPDRKGEYRKPQRTKAPAIIEDYRAPESYTIPKATLQRFYNVEAVAEEGRRAGARRWPYSRAAFGAGRAAQRSKYIQLSALHALPGSSELEGFLSGLLGLERFKAVADRYHLASWRGAAVYLYIDKGRRIRTGKAMYYKPDGHRAKDYPPNFLHAIMQQQGGLLPEGWKLRRCLFGEHLLLEDPAAPVALVESEKTAIIASALTDGGALWLASGGLHYLNADSCAGLKGRQVIAYPDLKAFDKWQERLTAIADKVGFNVSISPFLEERASAEDRAGGLDIADYLINSLQTNNDETGI